MSKPIKVGSILKSSSSEIVRRIEKSAKYVKYDFQSLALEIAERLNDHAHIAIYMKLAKKFDEKILRGALSFSLDYPIKYGSKGKIFMWKLKELNSQNDNKIKKDNEKI